MAEELSDWLSRIQDKAVSVKNKVSNPKSKPWYSPILAELRLKYSETEDKDLKKILRNKYVNACRAHKANYYSNLAEKLSKEGGVYKVLKRNKVINDLKLECPDTGSLVEDNKTIAEIFKSSFVKKTSESENMSKPNLRPIMDKLKTTCGNVVQWDVGEITVEETLKAIDSMKPTMFGGPDRISNRLIKSLKFNICTPFTKVANISLETGTFPSV